MPLKCETWITQNEHNLNNKTYTIADKYQRRPK